MSGGTTNALVRRLRQPMLFSTRYFVGAAIDIGAGSDSLELQRVFWPRLTSVRSWDKADGDARCMEGLPRESFDLCYSSHCLEHIHTPWLALSIWWDLVRPGGYLVVVVPDEDLYEQGVWPSTFNSDHKHTFTVWKRESWSPVSLSALDLVRILNGSDVVKVERIEEGFNPALPRCDQTALSGSESCIEFIVRKPG